MADLARRRYLGKKNNMASPLVPDRFQYSLVVIYYAVDANTPDVLAQSHLSALLSVTFLMSPENLCLVSHTNTAPLNSHLTYERQPLHEESKALKLHGFVGRPEDTENNWRRLLERRSHSR
jgi:hypothetical protein